MLRISAPQWAQWTMPAALSLNSSESQRVQKYCAPASGAGAARRAAALRRRLRYSARRTMFSINDLPVRNLILFIRPQFQRAYIHYKPKERYSV
jgi:hypothetical protein